MYSPCMCFSPSVTCFTIAAASLSGYFRFFLTCCKLPSGSASIMRYKFSSSWKYPKRAVRLLCERYDCILISLRIWFYTLSSLILRFDTFLMTQIKPIVFSWAMKTSPKAPLPNLDNNSKSESFIYRWGRTFLRYLVVRSGDYSLGCLMTF